VLKGRISDNKDDKKAAYNYYKRALEFDPTNKDAEAGTVLIDLEELPK
jgi:predicted negative regulator of RcsB-dependent stress response